MLASKLLSAIGSNEEPLYSDSVFSTYLYTGNGGTQTINNGIDLAGKGGMVWIKHRTGTYSHDLYDTSRGATNRLTTNGTSGNAVFTGLTAFNSSGFTLGSANNGNASGESWASWTFRKVPKFFDVVTYTGNGVAGRQIPHGLGIAPGMIVVKCTNTTSSWITYHRSIGATKYMVLEQPNAANTTTLVWNDTEPTASVFTVGSSPALNGAGNTYVAYLWSHDPSEDGIVQCGSFTTDASGFATVNLGWEPQYILTKSSSTVDNWTILDSLRGLPTGSADAILRVNTTDAEVSAELCSVSATGFSVAQYAAGQTYIYLVIRRPNKPPTTGTQVYNAIAYAGSSGLDQVINGVGFAPDLCTIRSRLSDGYSNLWFDKLRGSGRYLASSTTAAETVDAGSLRSFGMDGVVVGNTPSLNYSGFSYISHFFKRAPGFFDVVCYTGTGVARTVPHGLGVAPELMIVKKRSGATNWHVYSVVVGSDKTMYMQAASTPLTSSSYWNNTSPTASVFTTGTNSEINGTSDTFVTYLFASLPGISKVGSYTGNGTSQTIDCGFTTGARFILVKRTDVAGDWYVWDTARGIVAGNDPHLSLNSTAAEVTSDDSVDPHASGFIVNQVAATNINVSGGQYIFLAIS